MEHKQIEKFNKINRVINAIKKIYRLTTLVKMHLVTAKVWDYYTKSNISNLFPIRGSWINLKDPEHVTVDVYK